MAIELPALRACFPALSDGLAYFDGPGGTQTPRSVGEAIARTLTAPLSNRGTVSAPDLNAERSVEEFRHAYADLLNVPPRAVVFGRSATQLTYDFSRHLARTWKPGDRIVLSRLDHDSNVRPWVQAAERAGVEIAWIDLDSKTTELDLESFRRALTSRTRLVALTAASNVLGSKPDIRAVTDEAHQVGALVYVDGVHYSAHHLADVPALGADLFVCSPYKFLGPHCGVLAGRPDVLEQLRPDKLLPSPDRVPERFEFGTLPYETLAGATAAVEFLAQMDSAATGDRRARLSQSMAALHEHEHVLLDRLEAGLDTFDTAVTVHSKANDRTPTVLLELVGHEALDAQVHLAKRDVIAFSGSFYAHEPFQALGLRPALRIGLAPYSTAEEVDRLLEGLASFL